MKKDFLTIAALAVFVVVVVGGTSFFAHRAVAPTVSEPQAGEISLSIQDMYAGKHVSISEGETVLQVLEALNAEDRKLQLSTKTYSGLGTLVVGMATDKNGTEKKYWQYKVNGIMPQIGADAYTLKNGDFIEWFFAASQE